MKIKKLFQKLSNQKFENSNFDIRKVVSENILNHLALKKNFT